MSRLAVRPFLTLVSFITNRESEVNCKLNRFSILPNISLHLHNNSVFIVHVVKVNCMKTSAVCCFQGLKIDFGLYRRMKSIMRTSYVQVYLHIVWATWNREPMIRPDICEAIYASIIASARRLQCEPLCIGGVQTTFMFWLNCIQQ